MRYLPLTLQHRRSARRVLRRSLWLLLIPLGVALAAGPARLEKTFDTTRTPQVILSNLRGQVVVRGWEKAQVHAMCTMVSPRVEMDTDALPRTGAAERVQFATHVLDPLVTGNEETADCTLEVPLGASLEIKNRQGGVQIENLQGQHAHVESADGLISAKDVAGHLVARSLGGDIQIVRASGRVEAVSITGSVRIIAPASKNLRANTNSGQIIYQGDFVPAGEYISALFGVYGFLAIALMLFSIRHIVRPSAWSDRLLSFSFWGLNLGLVTMLALSLIPAGFYQLLQSVRYGTWYARSEAVTGSHFIHTVTWMRVGPDIIFLAGALALVAFVVKAVLGWGGTDKSEQETG